MSTKAKFILTYVGGIVTGLVLMFVFFCGIVTARAGKFYWP